MKKISKEILIRDMDPELKRILYGKSMIAECSSFVFYGKQIILSEDPLALPEEFEVAPVEDFSEAIPLTDYSISFGDLDAEQKYIYTQLLCNPFDGRIGAEYVYLLYQELERHLFTHDINNVFDMIIKLRGFYKDPGSFRNYSARVMLFISALMKSKVLFDKALSSFMFPEDYTYLNGYYFYAKDKIGIQLDAKDLMAFASKFGFTNKSNINRYPEIFEECLEEVFIKNEIGKGIPVKDCVNITEYSDEKQTNGFFSRADSPFANKSVYCSSFNCKITGDGKEKVSRILKEAHNLAKFKIAELRSKKILPEEKTTAKRNAALKKGISETALAKMENGLVSDFDNAVSPEEKYEACCRLCKHYYTYRTVQPLYSGRCIDCCKAAWDLISEIAADYKAKRENEKELIEKQIELFTASGDDFMKKILLSRLENLDREYRFTRIVLSFEYAVTVLKEKKLNGEALKVCDMAIEHYSNYPKDLKPAEMIASQKINNFKNEKKAIGELLK
ncbi:MAG: hypothetical protein J5590_03890 [Clostridia bacterium]|nr:hypothetical protein [Clostridia bacterium]